VVHGKRSLLGKMPGDRWQKFANLRAYLAFMYGHPGKKLLFMGNEFGQEREWNHDKSLDWHLLSDPMHRGVQNLVRDLNRAYRDIRAFSSLDHVPAGFEWIEANDGDNSVLSFIRRSDDGDFIVVVCSFTPVVRQGYRVGVPQGGDYVEILNSDSGAYGGGNVGNAGRVGAEAVGAHGRPFSLSLILPPLACVILRPARG
jgi:1,4-alpha-glucan branching enzyme